MTAIRTSSGSSALRWASFLLLACVGLAIVKWQPYYQKAFVAATQHSIGSSILTGGASQAPAPSLNAALDYAAAYGKAIWKAMVLGLLLGSALQVLLPAQWIARVFGARGLAGVAVAGLLSVPAMMCTCCAAPVVAGMRSCRASPGAAVAFWLGNTMLNPAGLVFMGFVLGWNWSALRLVVGLIMVLGLGLLVNRLAGADAEGSVDLPASARALDSESGAVFVRWLRLLARMSVRLIPEYVVLVLLLGAARAWLFPQVGPEIGNALFWIVAFACAGTLFVIPTAGEIPIVQSMLLLGVGVGPAAALLVTLPPISAPSVAMLLPSFPRKALVLVAAAVVLLGIAAAGAAIALGF